MLTWMCLRKYVFFIVTEASEFYALKLKQTYEIIYRWDKIFIIDELQAIVILRHKTFVQNFFINFYS